MNNIFKRKRIQAVPEEITLGNFNNFTKKEIFTQGELIDALLARYIKSGKINFDSLKIKINKIKRIYIVGSGIDYSCALFGAYNFEVLTNTVSVAVSSGEFIYSNPILDKNTLIILFGEENRIEKRALNSNSKLIKIMDFCDDKQHISLGHKTLGEFETASYTLKLTVLALLCLYLGEKKQVITALYCKIATRMIRELSHNIKQVLSLEFVVNELCAELDYDHMAITGTNVDYAVSIYAGKLLSKLKGNNIPTTPLCELYTIEGKHIPLALASNTDFYTLLNTRLNYQLIISPSTIKEYDISTILYNETLPLLNPILSAVVIQLIAYNEFEKGTE